ncbi:hypothetical protein Pint_31293 [Pistacia integerrima]|uniref:Uncharacterized protein n=1 Tax=Pistacia integerrima TaxID=434235 RepID=A0ACC0XLX9_9ROSI|nr:hypothetical protein Pint_31293 [Pistacia integerrima]
MSGENSIVCFNGKNYASWEFQFRMFVTRKELWGHLDGFFKAPTDPKELSLWESRNARIASWLLSSVEPHMVNNLRGFTTVKAMFPKKLWQHYKQFTLRANGINVSPHSLALIKKLVVLRWLIWHTLLKAEDDPDLHHNVIVAGKLGTLPNIAARNSATIARRRSAFVHISSILAAVPSSSSNITPEQVQQMIIFALSALGLQGKAHLLTSPWLIDSAASNHMTGSSAALQDVRKYDGEQHI